MKLRDLHEDKASKLIAALRKSIGRSWGINPRQKKATDKNSYRSVGSISSLHTTTGGQDTDRGEQAGSRAAGFTYLPTGIPHKQRHRSYFNAHPPGNQL